MNKPFTREIKINRDDVDEEKIAKLLKGIVICKLSGEYLVDLILDSKIEPRLLSSFVGALSLFGRENLGKIEEINIKGLAVEMIMITKYDLILIAIMDKEFPKEGIREEAEMALDMFYSSFQDEIQGCVEISQFYDFKNLLYWQIVDYFKKVENMEEEDEIKDFGFFTEAIKKVREERNGNGK